MQETKARKNENELEQMSGVEFSSCFSSVLSPLLLFEDVAPRSKDSVLHSGASGKYCKREMGKEGVKERRKQQAPWRL